MASAEDELREELNASEPEETREHHGGRIVEPDQGVMEDDEKDMIADLVSDDDDLLSAEEAAIHIEEAP
ncbi:MAG: hypothetical protein JWP02_1951 [Acidimicrobiales bacterium]|nr:hypothetical protein [Acidimicrobiales bacterium]